MRIRDLVGIEELGLTLLAGEEHLDRGFTGVQITDLPDPGRYLSGGELVLSGLMWRNGPEDSERFVGRLAEAGVAALGAGSAWLGAVPEDLVQACRAHGLPLLAVPVEVSFRTVAEMVTPRHAELRDALGRHRRIVAAVAEGAGLPELFALMDTELGMTGAVVSATGAVIAGTLGQADAVRLAHEYLTAPRLPHAVRAPSGTFTLFGVGREHRAAGWALVCGGDLLGEVDLGFELAACVALERTRMEEGRRVERRLAEQLIALACSAGGDPAELSAGLRTCGIGPAEPYSVVNVTVAWPGATRGPDPARLGGQVLEELLRPRVVAAAGADGAVALVPLSGTAGELAARLRTGARALTAGLPGIRVSVGLSAALTGPSAIRGGAEEAGHARRLAEARGGAVVTSDEIYTHALLLATVPDDVRRSFAARMLDPLFDYDRRHGSDLVRTLGTFLDCVGSWNACAERLHVHVNTVRYRIRRVEELTGRDLSTMTDRVDLFLALRGS
ncbi:sugar diacid utilization regulator [Streptosporangium album]|uniref:Sugar diacid utilization regulator n=1 Tax=Streptosporangium album TaxID=47479 RepID=A0A7W7WB54_9ACTN|nr:PucR family transcriptional regulator [Streptosporangium album]MBB4941127.1 sugar diacid utilization regulator [Streptosporangium album]